MFTSRTYSVRAGLVVMAHVFAWMTIACFAIGCFVDTSPLAPTGMRTGCRTDAECGDGVSCTRDVCRERECVHVPENEGCADDEECTPEGCVRLPCDVSRCELGPCETATCEGDVCVVRSSCEGSECCVGGTCMRCEDNNACTENVCSELEGGRCEFPAIADGGDCDTGDFCTRGACNSGTCTGEGPRCDDTLTCDPMREVCVGCVTDADCPDDEVSAYGPCEFEGVCDDAGMKRRMVKSYSCAGDICISSTAGQSASCNRPSLEGTSCGGTMTGPYTTCMFPTECAERGEDQTREVRSELCVERLCEDVDTTESRPCRRDTEGSACDPMDRCVMAAACEDGSCAPSTRVSCPDPNPDDCLVPACDPETGACVGMPKAEGASCTPSDTCMLSGMCNGSGVCQGGTPRDCDDDNPCTTDACSDGACVYEERDGQSCGGTGCAARACVGSVCGDPVGCTTDIPCQVGVCDRAAGTCGTEDAADGIECRVCGMGSTCSDGECRDPCGADSCTLPDGGACTTACGCDVEADMCRCDLD